MELVVMHVFVLVSSIFPHLGLKSTSCAIGFIMCIHVNIFIWVACLSSCFCESVNIINLGFQDLAFFMKWQIVDDEPLILMF